MFLCSNHLLAGVKDPYNFYNFLHRQTKCIHKIFLAHEALIKLTIFFLKFIGNAFDLF
jgi:hypothetical protein